MVKYEIENIHESKALLTTIYNSQFTIHNSLLLCSARSKERGGILLEIMAALVIFALIVPPLLGLLHESIAESSQVLVLRQARMLAQSKMEEILNGVEESTGGSFKNQDGDTLEGYDWSLRMEPIDFWPDPNDIPEEEQDRNRDFLQPEVKDSLITLVKLTLTVKFPGYEGIKAKGKESGEGFLLTAMRVPTEDDVRDLRLDTR